MNASSRELYSLRFRKVLEYIDAHLDEALSLDVLSALAAFSKYHFQRQFSELFALGVHQYVQLVRLRRASRQLAFRDELRVLDIALDNGYE
ncbi:MAG TPA: AraC family transcriptional regulator, partial [Polyangiaceae bacterium]|nr:AraC family transcriptional regulator [Polyangiaceae bacterium]